MNSKARGLRISIIYVLFSGVLTYAQEPISRKLSIEELFSLVIENNPSLSVSKKEVEIASQEINVIKNNQLPNINVSISALYIGNATILAKDFSEVTSVSMPHFGNSFSVEASQLIWKGGAIQNAIEMKSLQESLSILNLKSNEQNWKLVVLGYYLDLYKLQNQKGVYVQNKSLAEKRLENINRFYKQGMVTRNDVIRGELQISNLLLSIEIVENNIKIINKQLSLALGFFEDINIVIDENDIKIQTIPSSLNSYQNEMANHPLLMLNRERVLLYETSKKIARSEYMPSIVAFAGNNLQRPMTSSSPVLDMYANSWNVGLSLNYDIGSWYRTSEKTKLQDYEIEKAKAQVEEVKQRIDLAVHAAYIKYNEALIQNKTFEKNKDLANENYRIMESKYNNQLAIILDMLDASNTKLDTELQYSNSKVNIIYAYYSLLKESGEI